ncbi:hypothetical protein scyTo_0023796, partial [Scyliorhinus torazame]|nr:hypothetical protein [Scyliorhinus torazame]
VANVIESLFTLKAGERPLSSVNSFVFPQAAN